MIALQICDKKPHIKIVTLLRYPTNVVAKPHVVYTTH
jgi:hypothetical protein